MTQTTTTNAGTAKFNPETGELVLSGEITKELLDPYRPKFGMYGEIPTETPVTSILCEPGCTLPDNCSELFDNFKHCNSLNLSSFDTSNVTDMSFMFANCEVLESLVLSNFDTSKVESMYGMFQYCRSLPSLDLSSFNTSNVTDMSFMFSECYSLEVVNISSFDTSNVEDMAGMFYYCFSLPSLDLSSFNTSKVEATGGMFYGCRSLPSLDLSNFDTSRVTNMTGMFQYCENLTSLDLSNFETPELVSIWVMFEGCTSLKTLDLSSFDTSNVKDVLGVFDSCTSLETVKLGAPHDTKQDNLRGAIRTETPEGSNVRIEYAYPLPENKELVQTIENTRELPDTPRLTQKEKDWILAQKEPVSMRQVCLAKSAPADLTALDAQGLFRFADAPQKSASTKQSERKPSR